MMVDPRSSAILALARVLSGLPRRDALCQVNEGASANVRLAFQGERFLVGRVW